MYVATYIFVVPFVWLGAWEAYNQIMWGPLCWSR
jgi:hypothetical protein